MTPVIFVVDDTETNRFIYSRRFEKVGYETLVAASCDEAVDRMRAGERFDLLFTDWQMPGEVDGAALCEITRNLYPKLPIILITANDTATPPLIPPPFKFMARDNQARPSLVVALIETMLKERDA